MHGTSRLAQLQVRYQQKQREEIERKRSELAGLSATSAIDLNENNKIHIGNGKVRQMFDERRQRVTGIDKSYPLQPISSKASPNLNLKTTVNNSFEYLECNSQCAPMLTSKQNGNRLQNGNYDQPFKTSSRPLTQATTPTSNRFNKHQLSNRFNDSDYIENEQIPDIFSQLDDLDAPNSGRPMFDVERQMANMNIQNTNRIGSSNIKLGPVITKKVMSHNSATPLNTLKKLVTTQPIKPTRTTSEKTQLRKEPISTPSRKASASSSISASTRSQMSSASSTQSRPPSGPIPDGMEACRVCGRHFNKDRIEKHQSICKKTSVKKRKIFDATKHRVQGTEAEAFVKSSSKVKARKTPESPTKKGDWRRKHEEFIQAIRSAKQMKQHLASGGKLSDLPPPPPSENPDYVQCPHCKRRFNQGAAERHIPKCANFQFNKPKPNVKTSTIVKKRY